MLDKIVFTNQSGSDPSQPIDIGRLVESMIFYKTVYVITDKRMLSCLIGYFGVENLLLLIGNKNLAIYYSESMLVLQSQEILGKTYHKPMYLNAPIIDFECVIDEIFSVINLREHNLNKSKNRIIESIGIYDKGATISNLVNSTFSNNNFVLGATKTIISKNMVVGANLNDVNIRIIPTALGNLVETNIDFSSCVFYEKTTVAGILSRIISVEWTLEVASGFDSSLAFNSLDSKICRQKVDSITSISASRDNNVSNFVSVVLNSQKDIQHGVNEAIVSVAEVMELIEGADKFRKWLSSLNENQDILNEYYREILKKSWKDALPFKTLKFSLFTGAGVAMDSLITGGAGTIGGVGLGAFDAFVFDKLVKGWKPDQFVNEDLSIFKTSEK